MRPLSNTDRRKNKILEILTALLYWPHITCLKKGHTGENAFDKVSVIWDLEAESVESVDVPGEAETAAYEIIIEND